MEIERKFIPKYLPEQIDRCKCLHLEQAYIATAPVIRIRKRAVIPAGAFAPEHEEYILTVKSTGMMVRQEFELTIDADAYRRLLTKAEGNVISKRRYLLPLENDLTLELDVFDGIFDGLVIGEIEFPDEEAAKKYTPPAFLAEEVTFDTRFHNSTLSAMTKAELSDLRSWIHEHHCCRNHMNGDKNTDNAD